MVFPDGIAYDLKKQAYRTPRINTIILQIAHLARVSEKNGNQISSIGKGNSAQVAATGIEPVFRV